MKKRNKKQNYPKRLMFRVDNDTFETLNILAKELKISRSKLLRLIVSTDIPRLLTFKTYFQIRN